MSASAPSDHVEMNWSTPAIGNVKRLPAGCREKTLRHGAARMRAEIGHHWPVFNEAVGAVKATCCLGAGERATYIAESTALDFGHAERRPSDSANCRIW